MSYVNEKECEAAGLDPKEVKRIARGLSRYAKQAQKLGITIFGGSSGSLRADDGHEQKLIIAELDGSYDGGCGAARYDSEGLLRGE